MITKIQIINWKSFADATLYIDPLTVLIGANSSGKSNVLDALEFIRRIASGVGVDAALAGGGEFPPLRGGRDGATRHGAEKFSIRLEFSINRKVYEYFISVAVGKNKALIVLESLRNIVSEYNSNFLVNFSISNFEDLKGIDSSVVFGIPSQDVRYLSIGDFNVYSNHIDNIDIIFNELLSLFPFKPMPERMRVSTTLNEKLAYNGSNIAGFLANHEGKEEIEKQLQKFVTKLPEGDIIEVWAEAIGRTATKAELYCKEAWGDDKDGTIVDANSMSDGTLRFIAILVAVLTMEPGSLIAIEELDNGLHPSRAELLLRGLKELGAERGVDVLAVTHNPALLNALGPEGIPFVSVVHRDASGNSQITLLEDVEKLPKLMASGPLGDLVTQGKIQKALTDGED